MKRMDINKKFSEKVAQYLAEGYVINTTSMTGHMGEEGKVDLYKDGTLVRVWLWKESAPWTRARYYEEWKGTTMYLRVGKCSVTSKAILDSWNTYWMKDFEIIEEIGFYEVDNCRYDRWYFETLEEAMAYQIKHYERQRAQYDWNPKDAKETTPEMQEIGAKYLKRKHGYKRVCKDKIFIKKLDDKNAYRMSYAGNNYTIQ